MVVVHAIDEHQVTETDRHMAEVEFPKRMAQAERGKSSAAARRGSPPRFELMLDDYLNVDRVVRDIVGERAVTRAVDALGAHDVNQIETVLRAGDPADVILDVAHDVDADTIVIGSRGLGRFKSALLGGVSLKVNGASDINVVTVK